MTAVSPSFVDENDTVEQIIAAAFEAATSAGRAQFERDGRRDTGSCGGYLLAVDARGAVGKRILATGRGYRSLRGVMVHYPSGDCPSQHRQIRIEAGEAARKVFERHRVRVVEARPYVD